MPSIDRLARAPRERGKHRLAGRQLATGEAANNGGTAGAGAPGRCRSRACPGAVATAAMRVSVLHERAAFRSMVRVICHCCAIDSTLFTSQYSTRPAGKKKKNTLNAIGMIFITFACTGSGGTGLSRVWMIMVAPISTGRM